MSRRWIIAGSLLLLAKLWLATAQPLQVVAAATLDDRLYITQADNLIHHRWLGAYDHRTLAKEPFYSIWIAAMYRIHVPLWLSEQLLWAAACLALALAVQSIGARAKASFAVFAVLLFHPVTVHADHARPVRSEVGAALALLSFACFLGMLSAEALTARQRRIVAAAGGLALGAFWATREESIWIVAPLAILLLGISVIRRKAWRPLAAAAIVFAGFSLLIPLFVASMNSIVYGSFVTSEIKGGPFVDAYSALTRVRPRNHIRFVPVTREARLMIYRFSPAFREVMPDLEGELGRGAANTSRGFTSIPGERMEIAGGWMMWVLRSAVARAGHYGSPADAAAYYDRLSREVNAACDSGALPAGPRRSSMMPRLTGAEERQMPRLFALAAWRFFTLGGIDVMPKPSSGDPASIRLFETVTRTKASAAVDWPAMSRMAKVRILVLKGILAAYALAIPMTVLAGAGWLLRRGWRSWSPGEALAGVVAAASLVAIGAGLAIVTLIEGTSFPAIHPGYLAAFYPFAVLFAASAFAVGSPATDSEAEKE